MHTGKAHKIHPMERMLKIGEAAMYLNITVKTLQRWDRTGKLQPNKRSPGNRRLYSESQLVMFRDMELKRVVRTIVSAYCRVLHSSQSEELLRQQKIIRSFARAKGWRNVSYISECGSSFDFLRPKFLALMDAIGDKKVKKLILTHPDQLTATGYAWFKRYAERNGCDIIIVPSS